MCREGEDNESLHVSAARGPDLREKSPQTVLGSTIISWLSRKSQILGPSSQLKKYFACLWREKAEVNIVGIANTVFESLPQTHNHSWLKNTKTKIYWSNGIFFETIQWHDWFCWAPLLSMVYWWFWVRYQVWWIYHLSERAIFAQSHSLVLWSDNYPLQWLSTIHCTMWTLYSTIALWSKPEIQKPLSKN